MTNESIRNIAISVLLAALFIVAIYNFGIDVGNNYDTDLSIDDSKLNMTGIEQRINKTSDDAKDWEETLKSDNPFVATGALVMYGVWGILKLVWTSISVIFNIFLGGITAVFGVPPLVSGVILAIFLLTIIFAVYKSIKTGD